MQSIISERDKLQTQINTLKANYHVTVDRRPLGATVISNPSTGPTFVLEMKAQLTPSERDALRKAISPEFLNYQDWREGSHGEIFNSVDRVIFDVGFTTAIRKVLISLLEPLGAPKQAAKQHRKRSRKALIDRKSVV